MVPRRRVLIVVVLVAVGSTAAGFVAAQRITSPAEQAARATAPEAGPVTAPVERRRLESTLVTRGDVQFQGAVDVHLAAGGWQGPTVVTGRVPEVGDEIVAGEATLEITGRPVIALGGQLPTYRSLRHGTQGPDVRQLEAALERLGLDPGETDGRYDGDTATAVAALYGRAGYQPPPAPADAVAARDAAQQEVDAATSALDDAEQALTDAQAPPGELELLRADADVAAAQRRVQKARQATPVDRLDVAIAEAELDQAVRRRQQLADPDASDQQAAVDAAHQRLQDADEALWRATAKAVTPLPETEIVFISKLPRHVDAVHVARGDALGDDGKVMTVSGATMVVHAEVNPEDAALLKVDLRASIDADGASIPATITRVGETTRDDDGASTAVVTVTPDELTPKQRRRLRGANVKVTVPIANSGGKVLAVPVAALSATPDGGARVEVVGDDGTSRFVDVEVGLTADGYAEITAGRRLSVGDDVVVGR